ncbi:hypothetical protein J2T13_004724 [Paenibacillus sp. DS2015]
MIPLVVLVVVFALLTITLSSLWLYNDCVYRGINPWIWVLLMIATTPILGFILYSLIGKKHGTITTSKSKKNMYIASAVFITILLLILSSIGLAFYSVR